MSKPTAVIHHDRRYVSKDGVSPVKIKVTFKFVEKGRARWVRKFYGEGFYATEKEYAALTKPRSVEGRKTNDDIQAMLQNAINVINKNPELTVELFEAKFFGVATDTLEGQFLKKIGALEKAERLGSAGVYENALASLKKYGGEEIRFSEITPAWLEAYEADQLAAGNSINTVGIVLRSLRHIFNAGIDAGVIPETLYPFRKYKIRSERKFKIPMGDADLAKLKAAEPEDADQAAALDYWMFSYRCNGMNAVDVLKLRVSDVQEDFLIYDRSKSRRTKIQFKKILIPMDDEIRELIRRRGAKTLDPDGYLFPVLEKDLPASTIKHRVKTFIRENNKALKLLAADLKIKKTLTTVIARHTFANRMMNGGAERLMIQESLGHQNAETTNHYLGTMDIEKIKKARKAL